MNRHAEMIERATEVMYLEMSLIYSAVKELEQILRQYHYIPKLRFPALRNYSWGKVEVKFISTTGIDINLTYRCGNIECTTVINHALNKKQARRTVEGLGTPANIWNAVQALRRTRIWFEKRKQGLLRAVDEVMNQQARFIELLTTEATLVALREIRE